MVDVAGMEAWGDGCEGLGNVRFARAPTRELRPCRSTRHSQLRPFRPSSPRTLLLICAEISEGISGVISVLGRTEFSSSNGPIWTNRSSGTFHTGLAASGMPVGWLEVHGGAATQHTGVSISAWPETAASAAFRMRIRSVGNQRNGTRV